MKWFIVTGRIEFDDEDTLFVLQADDDVAASTEAERQLREQQGEEGTMLNGEPFAFYLNIVVECGDTKPRIMHEPRE